MNQENKEKFHDDNGVRIGTRSLTFLGEHSGEEKHAAGERKMKPSEKERD